MFFSKIPPLRSGTPRFFVRPLFLPSVHQAYGRPDRPPRDSPRRSLQKRYFHPSAPEPLLSIPSRSPSGLQQILLPPAALRRDHTKGASSSPSYGISLFYP